MQLIQEKICHENFASTDGWDYSTHFEYGNKLSWALQVSGWKPNHNTIGQTSHHRQGSAHELPGDPEATSEKSSWIA